MPDDFRTEPFPPGFFIGTTDVDIIIFLCPERASNLFAYAIPLLKSSPQNTPRRLFYC